MLIANPGESKRSLIAQLTEWEARCCSIYWNWERAKTAILLLNRRSCIGRAGRSAIQDGVEPALCSTTDLR